MDKLSVEKNVYKEHLNEWRISHLGEFVLIKGENVIGFFPTLQIAFNRGMELYGLEDYLIEHITPKESVNVSFYGRAI